MGFDMSWICVDGIDQDALYEALEFVPRGGKVDRYDLGTERVPWAGATLKSGWCAVFASATGAMDLPTGTNTPRLARLPAKSRSITCVVLEGPMVSYASFWQGGRRTWEILHNRSHGVRNLDASGDLPAEFAGIRDIAMEKQRTQEESRRPGQFGVDYVFDVPLETAATITGFRHDRWVEDDFFRNLRALAPTR